MVLPGAGHAGGVQMAFEYLNYFAENGNDVVCYVPYFGEYYGWKKILFLKSIVRILLSKDLQGKWFNPKKFILRFVPTINNYSIRNADITIATSWLTSYWVSNLKQSKGKKAYFIQDFETWGSSYQNKLVRQSYRLPFDLRIAISTNLHNKLIKEENSDSVVICNGIHQKYISNLKRHKECTELSIGFPYREYRGKENDIKNSHFAINSLKKFAVGKNVKLKAYGFVKPGQWDDRISFLENPSRKEIFNWYDDIDIFYVPSIYEGWGLPAMEAMARGCVVLASNTGCIYEYGKDKVNCYKLHNMLSEVELFNALNELIKSPRLRESISENAINTVKNFSFEKQAKKFTEQLQKII